MMPTCAKCDRPAINGQTLCNLHAEIGVLRYQLEVTGRECDWFRDALVKARAFVEQVRTSPPTDLALYGLRVAAVKLLKETWF